MRLPEIQLDDRRFQDLVSEARTRIARACPEWTEHNVSDPGITLIELFAWMTEMTIYRLNRVPDKLHVALLDLLGIRLDGPSAATTSLRFRLADKPTESILIEGGNTEVGTPRTAHDESVIFQVDEDFTIPAMAPAAYVLQRHGQVKDVGARRRRGPPAGLRPARLRLPAAGRRRALPRLRGAAGPPDRADRGRRLPGPRRGREPGGPAAALGGLPARRRVGAGDGARGPHGRLQLRLRHGRARAPAALGRRPARRASPALAALPDRRDEPVRAHRRDLLARARDLLDLGRADGRAAARHPRGPHRPRDRRRLRRHARPDLPAAQPAGAQAADGRDARGPGPRVRRLGALGVAPGLRRLDRVRPPLRGRPRLGRGRARPGDPRDARRLDAVRRRPAQGRGPALHALPPRRRARRQRHRGHAERAQERRSPASTP